MLIDLPPRIPIKKRTRKTAEYSTRSGILNFPKKVISPMVDDQNNAIKNPVSKPKPKPAAAKRIRSSRSIRWYKFLAAGINPKHNHLIDLRMD
jgi:hypothetical protein